jgi:hypothetical protein
MAEFEHKLTVLAERGHRVGPEELIERVEAELAHDPLVVVTKQRKGIGMSVRTEKPTDHGGRQRHSGLAWGVIAFAAILALGGIYLAFADGGGVDATLPEPATTPTTVAEITTTTAAAGVIPFEESMATIEAMIDAYNSGDIESLVAYLSDNPIVLGSSAREDRDWDGLRSFMAANDTWEITGPCETRGRALVGCPVRMENDFMSPAGIRFDVPVLLIGFDADGAVRTIELNSFGATGSPDDYIEAFDAWLEETNPEIHSSFGPRIGEISGDWGSLPSSADMPVALDLVDEFIADSDVYPLDGG